MGVNVGLAAVLLDSVTDAGPLVRLHAYVIEELAYELEASRVTIVPAETV